MLEEKKLYSWDWVNTQISTIGEVLGEKFGNIYWVTGVPRGGVIPAIMFSHKYDIRYIELEEAKSQVEEDRRKTVLFDDIADTGSTLMDLHRYNFLTATLSYRSTSKYRPHIIGETITDDHWLVFPWENMKAKANQDYLV